MSNECGEVLHGNGLVFCNNTGNRKLSTTALNTTTASVLQFSIGQWASLLYFLYLNFNTCTNILAPNIHLHLQKTCLFTNRTFAEELVTNPF